MSVNPSFKYKATYKLFAYMYICELHLASNNTRVDMIYIKHQPDSRSICISLFWTFQIFIVFSSQL